MRTNIDKKTIATILKSKLEISLENQFSKAVLLLFWGAVFSICIENFVIFIQFEHD